MVGKCTLSIKNYEIVQRNRNSKGGGLVVAISQTSGIKYAVTRIDEEFEQLWIRCYNSEWAWRYGTVYGLLENQVDDETIERWFYNLETEIANCEDEPLIIVGDFNAHVGNDEEGIPGNHNKVNRNGKKLRELMERRNLVIINSTECCKGLWTRVEGDKKSAIDFAICNESMMNRLHSMEIDEERAHVLTRIRSIKGKYIEVPSDHNVISLSIDNTKSKTNREKLVIFNVQNEADQKRFTKISDTVDMKEKWTYSGGNLNQKYKRWTNQVKSLMYQCFKRTTIKPGQRSTVVNSLTKEKNILKGELRAKQHEEKNKEECEVLRNKINLKIEEIVNENKRIKSENMKKRLEMLASQGQDRRNDIWKIRKKATKTSDIKLAIKSSEGKLLTEKEEIHQRYNEYYKDLLQPRPTVPESIEYVSQVDSMFENCLTNHMYDDDDINIKFNIKELEKVLKELKPKKCPGPDEIPREVFIHAGRNLRESLLNMINTIFKVEEIPDPLKDIDVKTMYKGKGDTRELKNQRGIFLSNEILKIIEKLIYIRIRPRMENTISEWQAGGRPKRNITDQLFILRSLWNYYAYMNMEIILEFLDLVKAFDKMILRAVLIDLWMCNIKGKIWRIIYQINKESEISIKTPFGRTNKFNIGECLKQGSVLATALAALHTDTVSRLFINKGINTQYGNTEINNLLFQDDIMRLQLNTDGINKANVIYKIFQENNRMEYHKEKSVYMCNKKESTVMLNNTKLQEVSNYKYLGDIFTNNNSYNQMIETRGATIRGTTAELSSIISEIPDYLTIKSVLSYYQAIIIPRLLMNAETWANLTKTNLKDLEKIQNTALKRILRVPVTTPSAILRSEVGVRSIENQIIYKKLMYYKRLISLVDNITTKILDEQSKLPGHTWLSETKQIMEILNIKENKQTIQSMSKHKWKKLVNNAIKAKQETELALIKLTAVKGRKLPLKEIKMKNYLEKLPTEAAITILKLRTGMLNVKANYKGQYSNLKCPKCNEHIDTDEHLLICKKYETQPLEKIIIPFLWSRVCTNKEIHAMSLAATTIKARLGERSDCDVTNDRHQEEEGASES